MRQAGITCLILGIGSFVLPMMGLQFKILRLLGEATPVVGGLLAVVGIGLVAVSMRQQPTAESSETTTASE